MTFDYNEAHSAWISKIASCFLSFISIKNQLRYSHSPFPNPHHHNQDWFNDQYDILFTNDNCPLHFRENIVNNGSTPFRKFSKSHFWKQCSISNMFTEFSALPIIFVLIQSMLFNTNIFLPHCCMLCSITNKTSRCYFLNYKQQVLQLKSNTETLVN